MTLSSMRILLVEGDPAAALAVRRALDALGIEVDLAEGAEEALRLQARRPYRIVIYGLLTRNGGGIELCRRLREAEGPSLYFLLCAERDDRARRAEALEAGIDDFLDKPLDPDDLRARLAIACRVLASEERATLETRELNESLRIASRRFEDLFNGLPVACFTYDATGGIHEWNQAAEEAFGIPAFDTLMHPVWEVLEKGCGAWTAERCQAVLSGTGHEAFEWTYDGLDAPREFACRIIALRGRGGRTVGAVVANIDVTAHKRAERLLFREKASLEDANARLHELASRDGLTGLLNRRSFMLELDKAVSEFHRVGKPFSLVLVDIDKFKAYNDSFGHPAGDEVLRRFARVLRVTARSYESPARYGGEEFAIVLHNTCAAKAVAAAERFRKAVEGADWIEREVTCSLGIATVESGCATADAVIASADAALYASKAAGRNRSTHATGLPSLAEAA